MANLDFGALLLRANILTPLQLKEAEVIKERTGVRLGQIIVDRGWVRERSLYDALARAAGLTRLDIRTVHTERSAIHHVDSIWALDHGMVPLSVDHATQTITVAVTDPTHTAPLEALAQDSKLRVLPLLGSEGEIGQLIRHQFFEEPLERGTAPLAGATAPHTRAPLGAPPDPARPNPSAPPSHAPSTARRFGDAPSATAPARPSSRPANAPHTGAPIPRPASAPAPRFGNAPFTGAPSSSPANAPLTQAPNTPSSRPANAPLTPSSRPANAPLTGAPLTPSSRPANVPLTPSSRPANAPLTPSGPAFRDGPPSRLPPARTPPPAPAGVDPELVERLRPVYEGHQDNAKLLQAVFELCVRKGIITRDEYLRRLAAADD